MLAELIARGSYVAVAVGCYIEGELVLVAAGALVRAGHLLPVPVLLAGATGSVAWGQTWFHFGRRVGSDLLRRKPEFKDKATAVERWLTERGPWVLLVGRFAPGMGMALPTIIGASGFPRARFALLDTLGALIWTASFATIGFGVKALFERLSSLPLPALVALGVATLGLLWLVVRSLRWLAPARPRVDAATRPHPEARSLILTADDFGLAEPVNEAVEMAYRDGALTTTSLMVGQKAADDAVVRARRNPGLRVGLHLTLCEGLPVLPPERVPLLTNARGELYSPVKALLLFTLRWPRSAFRQQLLAEIRAQFRAFSETGLELDHVNAHNNLQLHPAVLPLLMQVAREYEAVSVRVPYEPLMLSWRAARTHFILRAGLWLTMGAWAALVTRRLRRAGFIVNDYLLGVFDCGALNEVLLVRQIGLLPPGTTEIHCHPASRACRELERDAPGYQHQRELDALLSPQVRLAIQHRGARSLIGYAELAEAARAQ